MKAVVCLIVLCVAVFARAQDLTYEQAAYTDAAAPAPFEQEQQMESVAAESSFAETETETEMDKPGDLTRAAKKVGRAIRHVKNLFASRKNRGGNVSPSRSNKPTPVAAPKPKAIKPAHRSASKQAVKRRPIIAAVAGAASARKSASASRSTTAPRRSAPRSASRSASRRNPAVRKLLSKRGGRLNRPRAPAAAGRKFVDNLWHSERHIPKGSVNRDPEMAKLNLALEAVKEDILSTNKQINDERRWVIAVSKIISSYNTKMKRVEAHIIALRKEMKSLYRKKKQIENLKLQRALEAKLKEAKAELKTLTNSLKHVAVKQGELNKSGRDLRNTIAGIQGQLAKLRGQQKRKACAKGLKFSRKAKKCVSICKKGKIFSSKSRKCVSRCRRGARWNAKTRKCQRSGRAAGRKARKARKGKKAHRKF